MRYTIRIVEEELRRRLASTPAILIEGAKGCGKTATARRYAASEVLFDVDEAMRLLAELNPGEVLAGARPRLLDEWQVAPAIWNRMRREVDDRANRPGQFILTGSSGPRETVRQHTGATRIGRLRMRPMTLFESGHSDGRVSIAQVLRGTPPVPGGPAPLDFPRALERLCLGGWPGMQGLTTRQGLTAMRDMVQELARVDMKAMLGRRAQVPKLVAFLTALSRHVSTNVSEATLAADTNMPGSTTEPARRTVDRYLNALDALMITEDLPGWAPHLRSKARLRTRPKRHFVDPAVAVACLRATPETLQRDMATAGLLFESMVIRDLRVHAQANDATVAYYRDNVGLEVDAIVQQAAGPWAAFEVKLGGQAHVDAGAANLLAFRAKLDPARTPMPSLLAVVVAAGPLLRRDDGVWMLPVGALAP